MNKSGLIKLIDLMSFIGLAALISTGTLIKFSLPPKSGNASIWGLTRHEWGDIHFYISIVFLCIITIHLFLHLKFIKAALSGKTSRETGYRIVAGFIGLTVLILFLVSPFISPVESGGEEKFNRPHERRNK
ncbi:MAG: DUF4405 domain-containing protein [Proteobacteria bacterium]|nr:DUF4405 domain-containing protein [Pseudomonadota bacterium]NOG59309.1 DUF4405 domain-containing protein [Pseudomonadota bacterium]